MHSLLSTMRCSASTMYASCLLDFSILFVATTLQLLVTLPACLWVHCGYAVHDNDLRVFDMQWTSIVDCNWGNAVF